MYLSIYRENFAYSLVFAFINPKSISDVLKTENVGRFEANQPTT